MTDQNTNEGQFEAPIDFDEVFSSTPRYKRIHEAVRKYVKDNFSRIGAVGTDTIVTDTAIRQACDVDRNSKDYLFDSEADMIRYIKKFAYHKYMNINRGPDGQGRIITGIIEFDDKSNDYKCDSTEQDEIKYDEAIKRMKDASSEVECKIIEYRIILEEQWNPIAEKIGITDIHARGIYHNARKKWRLAMIEPLRIIQSATEWQVTRCILVDDCNIEKTTENAMVDKDEVIEIFVYRTHPSVHELLGPEGVALLNKLL